MKCGEIWRYKGWLAQMIDSHMRELGEEDYVPSIYARIVINEIQNECVLFHEMNTQDHQYMMQRATFVQIFEKDWSQDEQTEEQANLQMGQEN